MVGENGEPVTPDWVCESRPCNIFPLVPRVRQDEQVPPNVIVGEN